MSEHFTASNGWIVNVDGGFAIRSMVNPQGIGSHDEPLTRGELTAAVEYAATIGIHAPSEEREPLTHEMLHTILGESVLTVRGDHGKSYIVEEQHFDDLLEALQGKVSPDAPTIDADTLNAIILKVATRHTVELDVVQMLEARGFEVASLRNFMEVEARSPFARLPTIHKSEDDQGRPVLDGPMIQAVCQTISQMFGPHFVMTTSGGLRTPGEAGLDTAEWEEFRAWKAEQARLKAEAEREESIRGLFVLSGQIHFEGSARYRTFRDQLLRDWEKREQAEEKSE